MSQYISNTGDDLRNMLESIGVDSFKKLIDDIPEDILLSRPLEIPAAMSELDIKRHLSELASSNTALERTCFFLGGGAYRHFIPGMVDALISRAEFYTAYTPYQPEISQGTLQAIFEYQTLVCQLTGMDVSNASIYDGASSLAEAVLMAMKIRRKNRIIVSRSLNPLYSQVIKTYLRNTEAKIIDIGWDETGKTSLSQLEQAITDDVCAVIVQNPNFFGVIEDFSQVSDLAHTQKALAIYAFSEALSMGILQAPGELGADIVAGEGQSLGMPVSFGGPYLGVFATRDKFVRKMPGRIVGQTVDGNGTRGFVLTLSTREQHIRREKATSNICTNQGLCALTAAIYMSVMGKRGLRQVAIQNMEKAQYALNLLKQIPELRIRFQGPVFNEFVVQSPIPTDQLNERLREEGIIGGIPLECYYPELADCLLFCFTEMNTKTEIDTLAGTLKKII